MSAVATLIYQGHIDSLKSTLLNLITSAATLQVDRKSKRSAPESWMDGILFRSNLPVCIELAVACGIGACTGLTLRVV